jgi:hypothetical protein
MESQWERKEKVKTEKQKGTKIERQRGKDACKEKHTKCFRNRHGWVQKQRQKQDRLLPLPAN